LLKETRKAEIFRFANAVLLVFHMLVVGIWFALLGVVLVLGYFYYRDRKASKNIVNKKITMATEKRDSDNSYTLVIKEDGSLQVIFEDDEASKRLPSGMSGFSASYKRSIGKVGKVATEKSKVRKVFVDRGQMIKFLGGTITYDLPKIIPEEKGTYVLILHVWKNNVTQIEVPLKAAGKKCKSCEIQNDGDASYCKNCGKKLNK
jgi:hypothetical protein